jgi:putrescine transport system permease protein
VLVLSMVRFGVTPEINALATLIIVAVCVGVSVAGWLMHRSSRSTR